MSAGTKERKKRYSDIYVNQNNDGKGTIGGSRKVAIFLAVLYNDKRESEEKTIDLCRG